MSRTTVKELEGKLDALVTALSPLIDGNASTPTPEQVEKSEAAAPTVDADPMLMFRNEDGKPIAAVVIDRPYGKNDFVTFVPTDADGVMKRNSEGRIAGKRIAPALFLAAATNKELMKRVRELTS